jgi:hypothetical protein
MKTYSIVGMNFTKTESIVAALLPGHPVTLVREPINPFDPLAVAVWVDGRRVGYIPKKQNSALAQFIDQAGEPMALDSATTAERTIPAKFVRSANSGYPMVEVSE